MILLGTLFTLPSPWEMTKGIADYFFPFVWFLIKMLWPLWIILIVVIIIKRFVNIWLPDYLERKKAKK